MRKIIAILLSALLVLASLGCGSQAESKVEWGRADAKEIDVNSKVAGRVVELLVKEGDEVKAGQVIARISKKAEFATQRATSERGDASDIVSFNVKIQINDPVLRPGMRFRLAGDAS